MGKIKYVKKLFDDLSRLQITEKQIGELELQEVIQTEKKKKGKRLKENEWVIGNLLNNSKQSNTQVLRVPEEENK